MSPNLEYWFITSDIDWMSKYLDVVHVSLEQHAKDFVESIEKAAREMPKEEASELYEFHEDDYIEVTREFPELLFVSFVVMWYSLVEQKLLDLCETLELRITLGANDDENFGKGIRRARKFLLEAGKYEIDSNHWQQLVDIGKLRNRLVHDGRRLHGSPLKPEGRSTKITLDTGLGDFPARVVYLPIDEALYRYLKKHGILKNGGNRRIAPSLEYCRYLVKFGRELFRKLYADLKPPSSLDKQPNESFKLEDLLLLVQAASNQPNDEVNEA